MEQNLQAYNRQQKLELWAERVKACRESGLTVRQWCGEHNICAKTYYSWQRKVYRIAAEQEPRFAEVTTSPCSISVVATIQIKSVQAEIYAGADAKTLAALLQAMKSC